MTETGRPRAARDALGVPGQQRRRTNSSRRHLSRFHGDPPGWGSDARGFKTPTEEAARRRNRAAAGTTFAAALLRPDAGFACRGCVCRASGCLDGSRPV
ncbi:hypothetical protein HPB50_023336 [Hyalomma asiaticum]|uniref:Uncharacterized protein n=1 Tax=Hyalomma asiaticum TaxID=266040 RepID=A0ACB7TPL7_HYAAI|nr:hypothetical protein HPB50_023336 [Hyalomma asiaticum]